MAALSAMVLLEIPQVNIMTKMDLLNPKAKKEIEKYVSRDIEMRSLFKPTFKCHNSVFFVVLSYLQVSRPGYVLRDGGQLCCFEKQEIQKLNQGHLWFGKLQLQ